MSAPVPIAWISCVGEKGGAETLMIECLRHLDRKRFSPHVIQLRPGPLQGLLEEIGVEVHVLPGHRMREIHRVAAAIEGMRVLVRKHGLRLLHSNGFRAHVYGGLAAAISGVAEVWTTHTVEQSGLATSAILGIPTDAVLANCPRTAEYFRRQCDAPVDMIWPGVDPGLPERATGREMLAATYRLPLNGRWVSIGGRLQRYKGQIEFLRAMASVTAPDVHGIVIGGSLFGQESDYQRELRDTAAKLGLAGRVTFTGFVPDRDLAGLLRESYVTLHPAHDEDFGLAVAEAQVMGVPCIAFAAVGPSAIIVEGETGWLAPIGDQQCLNRLLGEALNHPEETARRGKNARQSCIARFGIEEHVNRTMEVYRRVLA